MSNFARLIEEQGLEPFGRFYGVYVGIVKLDYDPEERGRLLVQVPQVKFDSDLVWANPMGMVSGKNHGSYHIPATNDWVYIQFIEGNPSYPVWLPGGFAKGEKPEEFRNPFVMGVKSMGGHTAIIDDENETISVKGAKGSEIFIDDKNQRITLSVNSGVKVVIEEKSIKVGKGEQLEPTVLGETLEKALKDLADIFTIDSANLAPDAMVPANSVFTPKGLAALLTWGKNLSKILTKYT
jgi:hypothetical protein